ncbi:MAG: translocation/assembly module TamB domain-containing protein [Candidatus Omnitrophica bacterium]|nr:translocation/assembly module TamB domain-containing protein [Candidatus Omnitrophota bacterium]
MKVPRIYAFLLLIVITATITFLLTFYFLFTTRGIGLITKLLISRYAQSEKVEIEKINGTISQTLSFHEIGINNLRYFPSGSFVEIKKLDIDMNPFSPEGIYAGVQNGKIKIPDSEPVLFQGVYKDGSLDFNVYSKSIDVYPFINLFDRNKALKKINGIVNDIDVFVKGTLHEPRFTGEFQIESLSRDVFSLTESSVSFDLRTQDMRQYIKLYGEVFLNSGYIKGHKTAVIRVSDSKIVFNGNPKLPSFDLQGIAKVDNINIKIILKGNMERPDLRLSSEPSLAKERLLLMLATNKSWNITEEALAKGQMSVELVRDFMDYFLFSGSGGKLANFFRSTGITVQFDDKTKTKGVGVKKDISGKTELNYAIEEKQDAATTQKLKAEHKVSESVSLEAGKELKQGSTKESRDNITTNDSVLLKYKKAF